MIHNQRGYVAILSVLTIMAVVLSITTTVALLSIGEAQSSLSLTQGEQRLQFVQGCMEDALFKAWGNSSYNGGSILRPEGTCTVTVSKAGGSWTLDATSPDTSYGRSVRAQVTKSETGLAIQSWKEL